MRTIATCGLALALLTALLPEAGAHSRGARPGLSGGNFPGEGDCTRCHGGTDLNAGPGMLTLAVGDPASEMPSYTPGETVSLIVSFADTSAFRLGFQLSVRSGDGCGPGGSLATAATESGSQIRLVSGTCGPANSPVEWATHSLARPGQSAKWEVDWTAPADSVGPITVAVAANGADGSLNVRGDKIYTAQLTLEPAVAEPAMPPPMISDGGITMLGDSADPLTTAAPGAIAVANGANFAVAEAVYRGSVAEDGSLSTVAGGVCVEVSQVRAPVLHATSGRVLFQVPPDTGLGPAAVQVIRDCDSPMGGPQEARSNVGMLQIAARQPAFLQFSEAHPGVAALFADYSVVGAEDLDLFEMPAEGGMEMPPMDGTDSEPDMSPPDMDSETVPPVPPANPRPAVAGDVITVIGTGLGATEPALASGALAAWPHVLAAESAKAMIGQFEVPSSDIVFAGAAPGFAGLYQVSIRVPAEAPTGDQPFSLHIDGVVSHPGPTLAIAMPPPPPMPDPEPGDGMDDEQPCAVDLVLKPGDSCVGEIYSTNLSAIIPGRFVVKESGESCLEITGGAFQALVPNGICAADMQNPLGANLFIASRGDDNSWTITTLIGPPRRSLDPVPREGESEEMAGMWHRQGHRLTVGRLTSKVDDFMKTRRSLLTQLGPALLAGVFLQGVGLAQESVGDDPNAVPEGSVKIEYAPEDGAIYDIIDRVTRVTVSGSSDPVTDVRERTSQLVIGQAEDGFANRVTIGSQSLTRNGQPIASPVFPALAGLALVYEVDAGGALTGITGYEAIGESMAAIFPAKLASTLDSLLSHEALAQRDAERYGEIHGPYAGAPVLKLVENEASAAVRSLPSGGSLPVYTLTTVSQSEGTVTVRNAYSSDAMMLAGEMEGITEESLTALAAGLTADLPPAYASAMITGSEVTVIDVAGALVTARTVLMLYQHTLRQAPGTPAGVAAVTNSLEVTSEFQAAKMAPPIPAPETVVGVQP